MMKLRTFGMLRRAVARAYMPKITVDRDGNLHRVTLEKFGHTRRFWHRSRSEVIDLAMQYLRKE